MRLLGWIRSVIDIEIGERYVSSELVWYRISGENMS